MAYREVTMIEIKEVLRQRLAGRPKKTIAAEVGLDPKSVRRYLAAAENLGFREDGGEEQLADEFLQKLVDTLRPQGSRERGQAWQVCSREREFIEAKLRSKVRLKKVWKLLQRRGVEVPYSTLHRFAKEELEFGRKAATVPVVDADPGTELIVDTGWVVTLEPQNPGGRRRKHRAFIFTPSVSRYRFVYPVERETTGAAIEACEAAWRFYGGIFKNILVDNTKAIVKVPSPTDPVLVTGFLEYCQARCFFVDTSRVRKPTDKARVERTVRHVRDDCFGGETLRLLTEAVEHAHRWCLLEEGIRRHSRTQRLPQEHFLAEELPVLAPVPEDIYDIPSWHEPKVGRDHLAQVDKAFYSLPTCFIGKKLKARADRSLVKFYDQSRLVKTHPRYPPGGQSLDKNDFPQSKQPYVMRDIDYLRGEARRLGENIGIYADRLFEKPLPWARMRAVRGLLSLAKKHGADRLDAACSLALEAEMLNYGRLKRMLELPELPKPPHQTPAKIIPFGRYARSAEQYAVPGLGSGSTQKGRRP